MCLCTRLATGMTLTYYSVIWQSAPERFLVHIEQLEAVTGLQFGFLDGQVRAALDAVVPAQRFNRFPSFQNDTYASSELQGPSTGAER